MSEISLSEKQIGKISENNEYSGRIIIAGASSASGKTTLTLALLAALKARGIKLSSAKCGPDYVDPSLHREVLQLPSYNLDSFFLDKAAIRRQVARHADSLTVIEGVMGYYDGSGEEARGSTYEIASYTESPVVLVLSAKGMYQSLAALLQGFVNYRSPSRLKAVIFNGVSPALAPALSKFAAEAGLISLGCFPRREDLSLPEGRLGLDLPEKNALLEIIEELGKQAEEHLDLDLFLELAKSAPQLSSSSFPPEEESSVAKGIGDPSAKPLLAVAKDAAFCKIYPDNLELLEEAGFRLVYFSPLVAENLPEGISALYLPGGYPENYLATLAKNTKLKSQVLKALETGLPTIAEHGGAAYLFEQVAGEQMLGFLPGKVELSTRLQNFGYARMQACKDGLICAKDEVLRVHEFHYYQAEYAGSDFTHEKASGKASGQRGYLGESFYAGFAQLYFPAYPHLLERWYMAASRYAEAKHYT